jgi:dTDP-4-amino-4,6-dideoxygalactose transaminase
MYIPLLPPLTLSLKVPRKQFGFPFDEHAHWTASARASLGQLLSSFGVPKNSEVLVAAYMCLEVIIALRQMEYSVGYYNVPLNLECSIADIEPYITSRTKAVLITHYFGFPQKKIVELVEFAHQLGLVVIEDCAQTLRGMYKGEMLGTFGDGAIFSPRKIIGGLYSGIGWAKEKQISSAYCAESPQRSATRELLSQAVEHLAMDTGIHPETLKKPFKALLRKNKAGNTPQEEPTFNRDWCRSINTQLLQFLIHHIDLYKVHKKRLRNYNLLYNLTKGGYFRPLFTGEARDWCPYAFPVWVENNQEKVQQKLCEAGICAATWPLLPKEINYLTFPDTVKLKSHILLLPVHQAISCATIKKMSKIILQISESISP